MDDEAQRLLRQINDVPWSEASEPERWAAAEIRAGRGKEALPLILKLSKPAQGRLREVWKEWLASGGSA